MFIGSLFQELADDNVNMFFDACYKAVVSFAMELFYSPVLVALHRLTFKKLEAVLIFRGSHVKCYQEYFLNNPFVSKT